MKVIKENEAEREKGIQAKQAEKERAQQLIADAIRHGEE